MSVRSLLLYQKPLKLHSHTALKNQADAIKVAKKMEKS